jgi:hypothetical protein
MIQQRFNGVRRRIVIPRFKENIAVCSFDIPSEHSILTAIQNFNNNNFQIQTKIKQPEIYNIVFSVLFITKFLNDDTKYFYVSSTLINNYINFFREIEKYVIIPNILQEDFKVMFLHYIRKTITGVKNPNIDAAFRAIRTNDEILDNNNDRIKMSALCNTISRNNNGIVVERVDLNEELLAGHALKIINFIMFFVGFVNQNNVLFYTTYDNMIKPNVVPWHYGGDNFGIRQNEYLDGDNIRDDIIWCTANGTIQDRTNDNTETIAQGEKSANAARNINGVRVGHEAVAHNRRNARGNNL